MYDDVKSLFQQSINNFFRVFDVKTQFISSNIEEMEEFAVNSIQMLGFIFSNRISINNNLKFRALTNDSCNYMKYFNVLLNVFQMPCIYPLSERCAAIQTLSKMIKRIGWIEDINYRQYVSGVFDIYLYYMDSTIAKVKALFISSIYKIAMDSRMKISLVNVLQSLLSRFEEEPPQVQLAICKLSIHVQNPTSVMASTFKSLVSSKRINKAVIMYCALSWASISFKNKKQIKFSDLINQTIQSIEKKDLSCVFNNISLKLLMFVIKNSDENVDKCVSVLQSFMKGNSSVSRDYSYYLLCKYSILFKKKTMVQELIEIGLNHANAIQNTPSRPLFYVIKGLCTLALQFDYYHEAVSQYAFKIFQKQVIFPFEVLELISHSYLRGKLLPEQYVFSPTNDIFDGHSMDKSKLGDDTSIVYSFRNELHKGSSLLEFDIFKAQLSINHMAQLPKLISSITLYCDQIALLSLAIEYDAYYEQFLPKIYDSFKDKLPNRSRMILSLSELYTILGNFHILPVLHLIFFINHNPNLLSETIGGNVLRETIGLCTLLKKIKRSTSPHQSRSSSVG